MKYQTFDAYINRTKSLQYNCKDHKTLLNMDIKCPKCNRPMIKKNVSGQIVYVCPEHSSMKNILTSIAEESNNEISQYFPVNK